MTITEATKVADGIQYTEDGKVKVKTITGTHIVISFPTEGYNEVLNIYVDPDTELLTVAYDGGTFEIDPSATGSAITNLDGGAASDTYAAVGLSPIDGGDST